MIEVENTPVVSLFLEAIKDKTSAIVNSLMATRGVSASPFNSSFAEWMVGSSCPTRGPSYKGCIT